MLSQQIKNDKRFNYIPTVSMIKKGQELGSGGEEWELESNASSFKIYQFSHNVTVAAVKIYFCIKPPSLEHSSKTLKFHI